MRISDWSSDVCSSDLRGILFSRISRIDLMPKSFRTASASWSSCEKEATADRSSLRGVHPRSTLPSAAEFANQVGDRSEEHTSELQSLMRISYAVFCLKKKKKHIT